MWKVLWSRMVAGQGRNMNAHGKDVYKTVSIFQSAKQEGGSRLRGSKKTYMPEKLLITIITSTLNADEYLPKIIESIRGQTYRNIEWLIIDGGSNDGTLDILHQNEDVIDYWLSEPDKGIYNAWNKGLDRATGEWICFLGADDVLWDAHVLERMAGYLEKLPLNVRVAYGQISLVNRRGDSICTLGEPWEQSGRRFKQIMSIPHPGAMHRHDLFKQRGYFEETFRIAGDYELLLRELTTGTAAFVPLITVKMQQEGISSAPGNSLAQLREVRQAQRMHGQCFPGRLWLIAMARVYLRLLLWKVLGERLTRKSLDIYRRMTGQPPYWTKTP